MNKTEVQWLKFVLFVRHQVVCHNKEETANKLFCTPKFRFTYKRDLKELENGNTIIEKGKKKLKFQKCVKIK